MSRWISVEDKFPKPLQKVIVCLTNSAVSDVVGEATYQGCGDFVAPFELGRNMLDASNLEGVTHWRPMPEPPLK